MNRKKLTLIIGATLILLATISMIIYVFNKDDNNEPTEVSKVEKIDEMEEYDYYLEKDATKYYKQLYNELKDILNKSEINEEEYAKKVSQLFVTDLFTLDNKITSNDIGGLQFVYTNFQEDFINIAKTTLYSSVESNIYSDRKQELPIVSNTEIINIEKSTFTYQDSKHDSYNIKLNIEYEKDLDYQEECDVVLIYNDKYLQVVSAN